MRIDRLIVGNYRSFASRREIPLRPITLLYGWNNAGKSALVRLVAMLGDSVAEDSPGPLDTSRVLDRGGGFQSLLSKYEALVEAPGTLQLGIGWEDGVVGEFDLKLGRDGLQYVSRFAMRGTGAAPVEFVAARGPGLYVRGPATPEAPAVTIGFDGLVPREPALEPLVSRLRGLRQSVQWLGAIRARPPRRFQPGGVRPRKLGADGREAIEVLATDGKVADIVRDWFRRTTQRELEIREEAQERRLLLRPPLAAMDIDLVDTGEGMVQCLPVLVAAAMYSLRSGPRVLAVEEPESHLHPHAQEQLARFLCKIAAAEDPPIMLLETHSFAMLLGIQLAIANRDIPADRVVLHWLRAGADEESVVEPIFFDELGRPQRDGAIPVFAVESELADKLAEAQSRAW